ncbi:MAG TPA: adenylate/guanylate cyclase domain-containing protein, partial [Chloroflexota bacterium]|nr:adenylate/guanylate cyclase domain-containing protein [Chloroflexota bacterium]
MLRPTHRFCPNCGTPAGTTAALKLGGASLQVTGESVVDLSENRRLVTVVFADISGSTQLAERLDPEDLRRMLTTFFGTLAYEIQRYGGTVDKYIGDAVMAVFGAPLAHEDDAERAISAAIAMQAAISELNQDLQRQYDAQLALRIGMHSGEVVAGLLTSDIPAYTVVGDTVNTAQRFEAAAEPGTILVSRATLELTRRAFDFEAVPPLELKGKTEPRPAYRVLGPRYESIDPSAVPMVGRGAELARLRRAFEAASSGRGSTVHLTGDAGIGKSRLVRELRAATPPDVVQVVGRCVSFEVDRPYALLARLVRDVLRVPSGNAEHEARTRIEGVLGGIAPTVDPMDTALLLEVLGYQAHPESLSPESLQRVLLRLLRRLLLGYSQVSPVLIIAEDIQWADAASGALLAALARDIPARRCLLVSTGRPGAGPPWPAEVIVVDALPPTDARALMESIFAASVDDSLAGTILTRSGGNPYFIEEIVHGLRGAEALIEAYGRVSARSGAVPRVPATVQEVLEARLDRLPTKARRVLQVAAVCGRVFRQSIVQRLVPDVPLRDGLGLLESEGFILTHGVEPERTYTFRHALIQEVAYQTQLHSQLRGTHEAIAEGLETMYADRADELVGDLAFHYAHSANDAKAAHWLAQAGDRARALYASGEALANYAVALDRTSQRDLDTRASLLERIGEIENVLGHYDLALRRFRSALEVLPATRRASVARLQRKLGTTLLQKSDYIEAAAAFDAGLAALGGTDDVEAAHLGVQVGQLYLRRGDFAAARAAITRAIAVGERLHADDLVAQGLQQLGNVLLHTGDLNGAESAYRRSLAVHQRMENLSGTAEVRGDLGIAYRRLGRADDALAEYAACLEIWERIGNPWGVALCHNNMGEVQRSRGDLQQAIASYERAWSAFQSIGAATEAAITLIGIGAARVELGDLAQGRLDLVAAGTQLEALGSTGYLPDVYRYLATADLLAMNPAKAERSARRSLEFARAG